MGRNLLLSVASLVVLGLPAGMFFSNTDFRRTQSQGRNFVSRGGFAVVRRVVLPAEIKLVGQLEPVAVVAVPAGISGIVSEVRFKPGDRVRAGAVIAVVRPAGLQERFTAQRERIAAAEQDLKAREREWVESEKELAKRREWARQDLISRRELADAEASATTAKAALELAGANLAQQQAIAAQAAAANALGQVRAPISGQVIGVVAHPGEAVSERSLLLRLGDLNRLKLIGRLESALAYGLLVGAEARIGVAAAAGSPIEILGVVSRVDDEHDGMRLVEVELRSAAPNLRIGMDVEAKIAAIADRELLVLPRAAVSRHGAMNYVYIDHGSGTERREVKLGPELGDSVVVYGLSEGDRTYTQAAVERPRRRSGNY